ncbi:DUF167 domain-containing protein [Sphingomonas alpina]|uniref:UPF0235 protein H3Z74_20120 n=1 Tax=Sphingomonas alpina TaxID=653931 RepID=A0A7H0LH24_9SPHN|nr:DUF167 family protein [Sphingomonas alpina]QNQ08977.1 DUF167 domain-containing protein [Sphingomonas alpina]
MSAWIERSDGIAIAVRVTPRSSRESFAAGTTEHFVARLTAAPVEGAANAALMPLVAQAFHVPKRAVSLIAGDTARLKRLHIRGDVTTLAGIAAAFYEAGA